MRIISSIQHELTRLLIDERTRRDRAEVALRTIYDNCARQPRDYLVHSIMATIEGLHPEWKNYEGV